MAVTARRNISGKLVGGLIVVIALIFGAVMYYAQVYAYYATVTPNGIDDVQLTSLATSKPETIIYDDFHAIDADSSPIRYRSCFTTTQSLAMLTETYVMVDDAKPRIGPGWFHCFDADKIGAALEQGTALAFLGEKNIHSGVDRIVVIFDDGRGYAWQEPNGCGAKSYDGTPVGEACPDHTENGHIDKEPN